MKFKKGHEGTISFRKQRKLSKLTCSTGYLSVPESYLIEIEKIEGVKIECNIMITDKGSLFFIHFELKKDRKIYITKIARKFIRKNKIEEDEIKHTVKFDQEQQLYTILYVMM